MTERPVPNGIIRMVDRRAEAVTSTLVHDLDERWPIAFAAAVGDARSELTDLSRDGGIACHPVFPVCIEWPLMSSTPPGTDMSVDTHRAGLHVSHSIRLHADITPPQAVRTEAHVYLAERRTNATVIGIEFNTYAGGGQLLVTSRHNSLYRGITLDGSEILPDLRRGPAGQPPTMSPVSSTFVDSTNAVIYTECARIWNPIHTDVRVARAAGLPDAILHGTEVLARAVSALESSGLVPAGGRVTSVAGRFASMVLPGMTLTTYGASMGEGGIAFEVRTSHGTLAIADGQITFEARN